MKKIQIHFIDELAFSGIPSLRFLLLFYAGLMTVPPLNPVKCTLKELDLSYNNISSIPRGYFVGFKNLALLSMRYNLLHEIPDIAPLRNTIIEIQLYFNQIISISGALNRTIYSQLKKILLTGNSIMVLNPDMLLFWPRLTYMDLSDNRIVQLPSTFSGAKCRNSSDRSTTECVLNFSYNPIHCDKAIENILNRRPNHYNYAEFECNIHIVDLMWTKCTSPAHLCGWDLMTLGR